MNLVGRTVLITGATGGLGRAFAFGFAKQGCAVALHTRTETDTAADQLAAEIQSLGVEVAIAVGDTSTVSGADSVVDMTLAQLGKIDVLVNNAGVMDTTPFLQLSVEDWDRVLCTNLRGYFLVGQRVARHMVEKHRGCIINVSSTRQVQAWPGNAAYCASKGGIAMLTKVMALELAGHGVRVNSIAPGTIPTGLNRQYVSDPEFQRQRLARIPAGRLGRPDDVVAAALLLASDDADFIIGASIMVDGGQTLW